jgi:hypothetical protein
VKLVEPLIQIAKSDNLKLVALGISALVNLCNFSEDIKGIFFMKSGLLFILEMLRSKREDILTNVLRLILTLIGKSEPFTKMIGEENHCESVKVLLAILLGPGLRCTKFSIRVIYFVLLVLRQLIKHSSAVKQLVMDP